MSQWRFHISKSNIIRRWSKVDLINTVLHQCWRQGRPWFKHLGEGAAWVGGEGGARRLKDLPSNIQLQPLLPRGALPLKLLQFSLHLSQAQGGGCCLDQLNRQIRGNGNDSMSQAVENDRKSSRVAVHLNYRLSVRGCSVRTCAGHVILHRVAGAALQTWGGGRLRLGGGHLGKEGEGL